MRFWISALLSLLVGCGTMPPTVQESEASEGALELARLLREGDVSGALDRFLIGDTPGEAHATWARDLVAAELGGFVGVMGIDDSLKPVDPRDDLTREGVVLLPRISPPQPRLYVYRAKSVSLSRDGETHLVFGFVCNRGRCQVGEVSWGVPKTDRDGLRRLRSAHEAAVAARWDFLLANPPPD